MALYFVKKENRIVSFGQEINLKCNPWYEPFTENQRKFYEEHPEASVAEIKACQMYIAPDPILPSLNDVKAESLRELSQMSLDTLDKFVKSYQFANAQSSLLTLANNPEAATVYSREYSLYVIDTYTRVGSYLRGVYFEAENLIEDAETVESVLEIKEHYIEKYQDYAESAN